MESLRKLTLPFTSLSQILVFLTAIASFILFIPQPSIASSMHWSFDTSANFSFSASKLEVTGSVAQLKAKDDWFDTDWGHRKTITVNSDSVAATLTDFPMLLELNDTDITAAQSDGDDFLFTKANGTDTLSHEIESYHGGDTLTAWVRIPTLPSSSDTDIYLYYDNPSASNREDTAGVWPSEYKMVQHMNEDPSASAPQMIDSTENNDDGSTQGSMMIDDQVAGQVNGSLDFDGGDDAVVFSKTLSQVKYFSIWIKPNENYPGGTDEIIISNDNDGSDWISIGSPSSKISGENISISEETNVRGWSDSLTAGTWYHLAFFYNGTRWQMYINGKKGTDAGVNSEPPAFPNVKNAIGGRATNSDFYSDAVIDEYRVSDQTFSSDWITTEYNNQSDTKNFYTVGPEETPFPDTSPRLTNNQAPAFATLSSFSDTKPLEEGAITYQLSNDGDSWYYHNGTTWRTASDSTETNTASEVDNNISNFVKDVGSGDFNFRAFFDSDGTQQNRLDTITLEYYPRLSKTVTRDTSPADTTAVIPASPSDTTQFTQVTYDTPGLSDNTTSGSLNDAADSRGTNANYSLTFPLQQSGADSLTVHLWTNQFPVSVLYGLRSDTASLSALPDTSLPRNIPSTNTGIKAFGRTVFLLEFGDSTGRLLGDTTTTTDVGDSYAYSLVYELSEATVKRFANLGFDTAVGSGDFRFYFADTYAGVWSEDQAGTVTMEATPSGGRILRVVGITKDLPGGIGGSGGPGSSGSSPSGSSSGSGGDDCLVEQMDVNDHWQKKLRDLRDRLLTSRIGRWFTDRYYNGLF